jgi:hypothetical protein|tara:strand:- start:247 stop:441 length:195 start_codon:yes stop_codon:yes gene_type:complete
MTDNLKIYLTEFEYDGVTYDGPNIIADSFEEAEQHAENLGMIVVGKLDTLMSSYGTEDHKTTIH